TFVPMRSGKIGSSRQWVRTASSVPFARSFSTNVRRSSSKPRMTDRRGRAGSSSMISSRVIAFISSSVYPRYVNSFCGASRRDPPASATSSEPPSPDHPFSLPCPSPPTTLLLQPLRLGRHPSDLAAGRGVKTHRGRLAHMLVRPASVGMVDGIHCHAAHGEVRLAEGSEGERLLPRPVEGLVAAARARDGADRGPAIRMEGAE